MNIFGIGIDIIEIDRIENAIKKNPRFLERNFTEKEVLYFKENNFKLLKKNNLCRLQSSSSVIFVKISKNKVRRYNEVSNQKWSCHGPGFGKR